MTMQNSLTKPQLILYSTVGCHLCEKVELLLKQAQLVADFDWQVVEIMDLSEHQMQSLADKIPVLSYQNQVLCYPFSPLEIINLLQN